MKRALVVIMVALLIASVSGVNDASLAVEQEAAQPSGAHEREIASRVSRIGINRVVRIERADAADQCPSEDVLPEHCRHYLDGPDRRRDVPFAEIARSRGARHALRNVLIGVGIGVAVCRDCAVRFVRTHRAGQLGVGIAADCSGPRLATP